MAPNDDEPLDDVRAVAMTAGAAAARVVETVVRDAQNRARETQEARSELQLRQSASEALAGVRPQTPATGTVAAELPYDSPERRAAADQAMRVAGVPDEARQARMTADLLNGTDPQLAASAGSKGKANSTRPAKTLERERGR